MLFGIGGCYIALTVGALIGVLSTIEFRSLPNIDSNARIGNFAEEEVMMNSLRQQAALALSTLQGSSDDHP
jgi:hypothetical protein